MPTEYQISEAEWYVMEALWLRSPLSAEEVIDACSDRGWKPSTVKTLLGRLLRKGALRHSKQKNRYIYRPAVGREACVRQESRSFLNRVFNGNTRAAVVHLIEQSKLTSDQIKELQRLLEERHDS